MEKYLRKLQLIELDILKEIDRICNQNDIKYFLCNGSLLGAIRHKGFIPWDDDIDVTMTRKNYNKFINACKKELNDNYFLDCYETNKKYSMSYAKVKRKNTLYVEQKNHNFYDNNSCIWIDIFPLDGCKKPLNKIHYFQYKVYNYITTLISIKNNSNYYKSSKAKKIIYGIILKFIPIKFILWILKICISHYDEDKVDYLTSFSTVYGIDKETFEKKKINKYQTINFENYNFGGIKNYDYYLKKIYGNYMQLPPEEKRINHKPYIIKFPDGEIMQFELKSDR